ncbi:hypothetical protein SAMN05421823_108241 [Catalinimonas alkaloidigena]|uniref:Uncharacterized protein n=1 Tax=Catalinimonas alkaloidigena TaxID=1075417 RepID=A0A1G9NBP3_9BACT|nr:hypothetical protein [Catalinimonas alkaloidigena]SDL83882.1 hypothetical protein SAMN05421823_108241 [Catalinimonas alkaloidigena]
MQKHFLVLACTALCCVSYSQQRVAEYDCGPIETFIPVVDSAHSTLEGQAEGILLKNRYYQCLYHPGEQAFQIVAF